MLCRNKLKKPLSALTTHFNLFKVKLTTKTQQDLKRIIWRGPKNQNHTSMKILFKIGWPTTRLVYSTSMSRMPQNIISMVTKRAENEREQPLESLIHSDIHYEVTIKCSPDRT